MEVGVLIHRSEDDNVSMRGKRFEYDDEVVLRKNSVDSLGNPIGVEERVCNPSRRTEAVFDPRFRIGRKERDLKQSSVERIFGSLGIFCEELILEHSLDRIIFFGGQEDINLLRRAGLDLRNLEVGDIQTDLRKETGSDLSLDKASLIIGYNTEGRTIISKHFRYTVPEVFKHLLRPHKAIGDVSRMFLLDRELKVHRKYLVKQVRDHIRRIDRYRLEDEEIPIF